MSKHNDFLDKLAPKTNRQLDNEIGANQSLDKDSLITKSVQVRKPLWKKLKLLSVEKEQSMVDLVDKCISYSLSKNIFKK